MLEKNPYRPIVIWLFTGCFLVYLMVLVGGITRLTHSGLSMVDWSPVGSFPPMNERGWIKEFNKYKQSPEYVLFNYNFTIEDFKNIFWWEYLHRFIGRTIGVVFLIPFFYFLIKKKFPAGFFRKMLWLLLLGAVQGLVGWYMVKSGLVKNPHVSHYRLAAHLITAFTVFGFTFWFALDLIYPSPESVRDSKLKNFSMILFGTIILQIIYGAFVAGLKAGYLYPGFPKMGSEWMPEMVYTQLQPVWRNFTEGQAGVQFIHRCLAFIIVFLVFVLFFWTRNTSHTPLQRKLVQWLLIIVLVQFLLGVATVIFNMPIAIALIHQSGAFFLFSAVLLFIHRLR